MMKTPFAILQCAVIALLMSWPALAYAHNGGSGISGFLHELAHALSGLNHVNAMLAAGLWASQLGLSSSMVGYRAKWGVSCGRITLHFPWRQS